MTEAMALMFASLIKGTLTVIMEQMKMAGATEAQINEAVIKARDELASMDPDSLPKQA
jgi:hypothetical protein